MDDLKASDVVLKIREPAHSESLPVVSELTTINNRPRASTSCEAERTGIIKNSSDATFVFAGFDHQNMSAFYLLVNESQHVPPSSCICCLSSVL